MDAYGTQRNPKSLKSFIARQPYKNLLHLLHLLHLPPYSPPWSVKLKLTALKNTTKSWIFMTRIFAMWANWFWILMALIFKPWITLQLLLGARNWKEERKAKVFWLHTRYVQFGPSLAAPNKDERQKRRKKSLSWSSFDGFQLKTWFPFCC